MRCDGNKLTESVFAIVLFATLGALAMLALARQIGATEPALGDIVSFANVLPAREPPLMLSAIRSGAMGTRICALDTSIMADSGGSLFVEAPSPRMEEGFRVHWAGGPTSTGAGDCGSNSELVLNAHQLEELAAFVGGFGVSHGGSVQPMPRADLQAARGAGVAAE